MHSYLPENVIRFTAQRILERRGIQTLSSFVKIYWSVFLNLKPISYSFGFRIYWRLLDHDLKSSIGEKAISILAGNLNSSRSYLTTAVLGDGKARAK